MSSHTFDQKMEQTNKRLAVLSDHLKQEVNLEKLSALKTSSIYPNGLLFNQVSIITGSGILHFFCFENHFNLY